MRSKQPEPENLTMVWRRRFARHAACFDLTANVAGIALSLAEVEGEVDWSTGTWSSTDKDMGTAIGRTADVVRRAREAMVAKGWWTRSRKGGLRGEESVASRFTLALPAACPIHGVLSPTGGDGQLGQVATGGPTGGPTGDHRQRSTSESEAEPELETLTGRHEENLSPPLETQSGSRSDEENDFQLRDETADGPAEQAAASSSRQTVEPSASSTGRARPRGMSMAEIMAAQPPGVVHVPQAENGATTQEEPCRSTSA